MEIEDSVAVIASTHSQKDVLSLVAVTELADLLDSVSAAAGEASMVVLTGTDGRFVPDVDREELVRRSEGEVVSGDVLAWHRVTSALQSMVQPTVAAIDGNAAGGGCVLALACTFRICSDRSLFGPVEQNLGILGTDTPTSLVRLVGPATAAELLLTERQLEAATAKQVGLMNEVLPSEDFAAHARRWCQPIAALRPVTVFAVKQAVQVSTSATRAEVLDLRSPDSSAQAGFK